MENLATHRTLAGQGVSSHPNLSHTDCNKFPVTLMYCHAIQIRTFVNKQTLITLYHCLVDSYLAYPIEVWGLILKTYLTKLMTLQNKLVRAVGVTDRNTHTNPLF